MLQKVFVGPLARRLPFQGSQHFLAQKFPELCKSKCKHFVRSFHIRVLATYCIWKLSGNNLNTIIYRKITHFERNKISWFSLISHLQKSLIFQLFDKIPDFFLSGKPKKKIFPDFPEWLGTLPLYRLFPVTIQPALSSINLQCQIYTMCFVNKAANWLQNIGDQFDCSRKNQEIIM